MTTLIESRSNRLGIEVRHEKTPRGELLRVYRNGKLLAERAVERRPLRAVTPVNEYVDVVPYSELLVEVGRALEEGLRVLRDGRGLCEAA